jgi:hypothetical protein
MKRYLLIPILAGIVILGGCSMKNNSIVTPSVSNNVANSVSSSTLSGPVASSSLVGTAVEKDGKILYTNDKYGFSLEFPNSWQGFVAADSEATGSNKVYDQDGNSTAGWPVETSGISFLEKYPDYGNINQRIFQIDMYTKGQWTKQLAKIAKLKAEYGDSCGDPCNNGVYPKIIAQNDKYYFTYFPETFQYYPGTSTQERIKEVSGIISTFKIISPVISSSEATSSIAGTGNVLYQNYKYNFELQYPSDYKINSDMVIDSTCKNYGCKEATFEVQNGSSSVSMYIFPVVYEKDAISYVGGATSTIEKDGLKVEKVVYPNGTQSPGAIWYLFDKNNKGYMMSFNTGRGTGDSEKMGQEIFNSLKFNNN